MTPKPKEQRSAGELEEDTCTRRKRLRRVSFAETTVHVFKRDDDSESPANSSQVSSEGCRISDNDKTISFGGIQYQGDDTVESATQDKGGDGARLKFGRDMDLSSPGSAVGSATSNDDENFFGPVSTSFINSGHLREPEVADDNNHDITLDSTAFSLHFRNIALPDDQSCNSAGSLRTLTGDRTPTMPPGILVERNQTEKLSGKCSVGQMNNVSWDWSKNNPNVGGPHRYEYGKLSLTLEALMDEVNLIMQHKSPIGDRKFLTSCCQTDEVGGIRKPWKDGEEVSNQNTCYEDPGYIIHYSVSPMGPPISNESLLHAKAKSLTSHSSEKIKEIFSPVSVDKFGKGHEAVHPVVVITDGQNSKLLSPSHGELQSDLNGQVFHAHQELCRSTTNEGSGYPDSSLHSISAIPSISDYTEQKLDPVTITYTPAIKSFHSSPFQEMTPSSHGQEPQHFLSQTVSPSSKFLSISARENLAFRMETPDNPVKAIKFSSLKGSASSFQAKQLKPLNFSVLSQGELMHDAARQQSASLRKEIMEHGEKISAIKNHITRANVKSRMQSECDPAPSSKDLFVTVLQSTPNDVSYDRSMKHIGISAVNMGATEVNAAKQTEAMIIENISDLTKLDRNASLQSMETPDNIVKAFRFSTLKGSISSYQDKKRLLQHSVMPQSESLRRSARDHLSASLKMELREHAERISAIKTSITRSRFKSRMQTDCEAAPLMKDLFITNFQGSLNEINDGPYLKYSGISDVNIDANEVTAANHLEGLDIARDLDCSRNSNYTYLTALDKNSAFIETVEKGQSEKCIDYCCDSSFQLHQTLDPCASSIDQREAYLKESEKDISSKYVFENNKKLALSSDGCVTSGVDEITSSRDMLERKTLQPDGSLVSPLNENLANWQKKVIESSAFDPYKATGEVLEANTTSTKSLQSSAEKIVQYPGNHSFNTLDMVSPKKYQQERYRDPRHHTENVVYSESYMMQKSPVTVPEVTIDSLIPSVDHMHYGEALDIAGKAPMKLRTDVFSKLYDTANQLLPQSTLGLSLEKLDDMESLLDELQISRKYEGLCITLRNGKSNLQQKRVIDARSLQEMLVIAKARKELKCMKFKKLHSKAQILQSQVEECGKLKSIYDQLRDLCARVVESDESSYCRHQVHDMKLEERNRLTAMKQELAILEQNIKLLLNSFEASCKLTGKMSCNDAIKAVDEHVMRRAFCKEIQQHVQLEKLCDIVMENDHYKIIFGFCNLLFQRFTINKSRFSNIVANISSNAANITKKYPNMNACIAFEFVFKLNVDRKLANSTCIYERIVETGLVMGTLIDVLDQILLSRLELLNLVFSTFLKQTSGELELQLCFYSFSSGRKLILGIDLSHLNCGIYPSDPSELKIQVCAQQTTLPSSIVNMAIAAVRNLDCGHLMIRRLCSCVSEVIQCSST